jgi:signal transduction histidine kinase
LGRFCHGLTFFSLGLTVSFLQSRSHRITLARRLTGLSIFAFGQALYAWYALLRLLMPSLAPLPCFVPPLFLATAYTSLLAFGIQTLMSEETYQRRFRSVLLVIIAAWLVPYAIAIVLSAPNWASIAETAEVLLRFTLAFPGGILTALGMRRQSYQYLDPSLRQKIRPNLRLTELGMAVFGALNLASVLFVRLRGLICTAGDLNSAAWGGWIWALVGTGITVGLAGSLNKMQSAIEQWVEDVERLQALADDRERIGRELHDGIIQSIYAAGLLLESIQAVVTTDPERAQAQLGRVMDSLTDTIQDIRRYIFDLRSGVPDDDLQTGIQRLLQDFHINTLLETEFQVTGIEQPIHSMARRRHLFQIVREALANTAKHAHARWVEVDLNYDEEGLTLTISDDGVGMETLLVSKGYGLRNIRERARLLGGTLRIESAPDAGVTYHLTVPYA